jgi:hypothetical protein
MNAFPYNTWGVRAGFIMSVPGSDRADLIIRQPRTNFEFAVEWRLEAGGSSGIIYLVQEGPPKAVQAGLKMVLADNNSHPEAKRDRRCQTGALYDLLPPAKAPLKPVGDWNEARIIVRTNQVQHWLNGEKVLEFDLDSETLKNAIKKSRFKDVPEFGEATDGYIVLEHGGPVAVWFRNPRVRILPELEPEKKEPLNTSPPGN